MFFAKSKKHIQLKFCLDKFIRQIPVSTIHQHAAHKKVYPAPAFSYVWYWRDLVRSVMCHKWQLGFHFKPASFRIIHFLQEMNFGKRHFQGVYAKETDPTVLLLSTKASSSQWNHKSESIIPC
jgi:hypothetical protein